MGGALSTECETVSKDPPPQKEDQHKKRDDTDKNKSTEPAKSQDVPPQESQEEDNDEEEEDNDEEDNDEDDDEYDEVEREAQRALESQNTFDFERDGEVHFTFENGEFGGSATDQGANGVCYAHAASDLLTIVMSYYKPPENRSEMWCRERHSVRREMIRYSQEKSSLDTKSFRKLSGFSTKQVLRKYVKTHKLPFLVNSCSVKDAMYCHIPTAFSAIVAQGWHQEFENIRRKCKSPIQMTFEEAKPLIEHAKKVTDTNGWHEFLCLRVFEKEGEIFVCVKNSWHCFASHGVYTLPYKAFVKPEFLLVQPLYSFSIRNQQQRHRLYNALTKNDPKRWNWQPEATDPIPKRSRLS
eukprot:c10067_g1_i2.p1 GENE.c10067_g1_i2~~c10067_g1_i2.p1  ORF type:complete len:354 (+),score=86.00 c10067_g1_i2:594-1655(+)